MIRVNEANGCYFAKASQAAVYVTRAHNWNNRVAKARELAAHRFDLDRFNEFLRRSGHNITRF